MLAFPLFYYPTTVVWVDDDEFFLQVAADILGNNLKINTFTSPASCLEFFEKYVPYLAEVPLLCGRSNDEDYDNINHLPVDINTAAFTKIPEQLERKDEVCLMIVDYRMPGITGIDLCRQLKHIPAKKILLTGEMDDAQAISAFNEGIIDCFIKKDSPTLLQDIKDHFELLSNEYLSDRSKILLSYLETDKKIPLSDPIFVSFFKNWCQENRIREHYIFDKVGNLQIIDDEGRKFYFIIHTDSTLDQFIDIYHDNSGVSDFVLSVSQRKKIPFFGMGQEGWQYDAEKWLPHFYVPKILEGREKYYWAIKEVNK